MAFVNRLIPFLLAALLIVSSQSAAVTTQQSTGSASIVICSGDGPKTIVIDGTSQPAKTAHHCFDCCFSNVGIEVEHPFIRARKLSVTKYTQLDEPFFLENRNSVVSFGRGPPALI